MGLRTNIVPLSNRCWKFAINSCDRARSTLYTFMVHTVHMQCICFFFAYSRQVFILHPLSFHIHTSAMHLYRRFHVELANFSICRLESIWCVDRNATAALMQHTLSLHRKIAAKNKRNDDGIEREGRKDCYELFIPKKEKHYFVRPWVRLLEWFGVVLCFLCECVLPLIAYFFGLILDAVFPFGIEFNPIENEHHP